MSLELQSTIDEIYYEVAELKAQLSNLIRPVVIKSFDPATNKAVATLAGDAVSHELPVFTHAGAGRHWSPMKAGQQATMLCPGGDPANAFLIPGGYTGADEKPSARGDEDVIAHGVAALRVQADGTVVCEVASIAQFKIKVSGQTFTIRPQALQPG